MKAQRTLDLRFGEKHRAYIRACRENVLNIAEGAVRAGKTIDNVFAFRRELEDAPDRIHLATGSTVANAKLNIGDANGYGLEYLFRGRCRWGKFKDNDALFVSTATGPKVVIFAGGAKADSFKKIRGNSYGMWIATEINLHHDNTIKEAFNRQLAAKRRKIFWDLNPDNPGAAIYADYIDAYRAPGRAARMGGVNYAHFTIDDNGTISDEARERFKAQYLPGTVWYRRDILGQRCAAEGLCYPAFANDTEAFLLDAAPPIQYAAIGVDFGGTKSAHSFTLTGFTPGMREVVVLDDYYHDNRRDGRLSPAQLDAAFVAFARRAQAKYRVAEAYCDSAEQTLIQGLVVAAAKARLPVAVRNAIKGPINDRIAFYNSLMAQRRFRVLRGCTHTIEALCGAVFDPKPLADERLDDGTVNVDSLDSMEYATESVQKSIQYLDLRR